MPVGGDIITRSTIRGGTHALAQAGAAFQTAGSRPWEKFAPQHSVQERTAATFPLAPAPATAVADTIKAVSKSMVWGDDMLCYQRAALGAAMLQQAATGTMAAPTDDAFVAGVAMARSASISKIGWGFHSATIFREQGERGVRVLDLLLFAEPVSLSRWAQALGTSAKDVVIESPFLHAKGDRAVDISSPLAETWERMPTTGYTMASPLRLPVDGTSTVLGRVRANIAAA